jgi:hypothetical protein
VTTPSSSATYYMYVATLSSRRDRWLHELQEASLHMRMYHTRTQPQYSAKAPPAHPQNPSRICVNPPTAHAEGAVMLCKCCSGCIPATCKGHTS